MARGKGFITTMNLCLPGLGQLFAGRWILGTAILLFSVLFFLAGAYFALLPLYRTAENLLADPSGTIEVKLEPVKIAVCFGMVIILWVFSIAEGICSRGKKEEEKKNE